MNNKNKYEKYLSIWKLHNKLLYNLWAKKEVLRKFLEYLTNENKNINISKLLGCS